MKFTKLFVAAVVVVITMQGDLFAQGMFGRRNNQESSATQTAPAEQTVKPKAAVYIMGEPRGHNVLRISVNNFLIQSGKYQMIAVDALDVVSQEHERQMSGEVSDDEIAALGQDAGAEYVFVVERTGSRRQDGRSYIALRLVNVESKVATLSEMAELVQGDETVDVVRRLINRMLGVNIPAPENNRSVADAPQLTMSESPAQQPEPVQAVTTQYDDAPQIGAQQTDASTHGETWIREWLNGFEPVEKMFERPNLSFGLGMTTVRNTETRENETWSMLLLGAEFSIWRFGVFLDFEFFFNEDLKFQDKGWNFGDDFADALFRKIRYIRFGQVHDPLFVRFGGLSSESIGYGIIVDRFTNMLYYPEDKLLGLKVHVNDFSPIGLSLQTMISDFAEVSDGGGVVANRLSVMPLKMVAQDIPLVNRLTIGATHAFDRDPSLSNRLGDTLFVTGQFDTTQNTIDTIPVPVYNNTQDFGLYGFDIGLPLIAGEIFNLTLYSQFASRTGGTRGWGASVPGVAMNIWRFNAIAEYRFEEGKFTHGFFDRYYLDERLRYSFDGANNTLSMTDKSQYIDSVSLSGPYGRLGMDLFGLLYVDGSLSRMSGERFIENGESENVIIRGYEATLGAGEAVMEVVPVLDLAEIYIRNSNIGMSDNVRFRKDSNGDWWETDERARSFDRTPFMFWGYRAGIELGRGSMLILDHRFGYRVDVDNVSNRRLLKPDNRVSLMAAYRY